MGETYATQWRWASLTCPALVTLAAAATADSGRQAATWAP